MSWEERVKKWLSPEEQVELDAATKVSLKYQDRIDKLQRVEDILAAKEEVGTCWMKEYNAGIDNPFYKVLSAKDDELTVMNITTYHDDKTGKLRRFTVEWGRDNPRYLGGSKDVRLTPEEFSKRIRVYTQLLESLALEVGRP